MLLFPAFRHKKKMQKITLGENAWVKINEKMLKGRRRRDTLGYYNGSECRKNLRGRVFPRISVSDERYYLCPDKIDALKRGELPRIV